MQLLETYPACSECLIQLSRDAAVMAGGDKSGLPLRPEATARRILEEAGKRGLTSPAVGNMILREIREISGVWDPYAVFKTREMDAAKAVSSRIEADLGEDLRSRAGLAALGNSLDFFKSPEEALVEIPEQLRRGIDFFRDDTERLETFLAGHPALVLYLTDNSGEIYFDRPLYDYLRERSGRTVLAVKGGPSLNDLTRAELRSAGLEEGFEEVADTGTDGAGIEWDRVSPEFLDLVEGADLIISKGMANLENLYEKELSPAVFFLLKVKCQPIQDYLNIPVGNFVALWKEGASGKG
jgi:uncharacterized protein with ATP-grasp and redox domains